MTARRISCLVAVASVLVLAGPLISNAVGARPEAGSAGACSGVAVSWRHGVASLATRAISCARAKHVVAYALNHGLLAPSGNPGPFFALRRRHVLGFTFTADARDHTKFHAHKGEARITFHVCWLNVDC